jgi:hypothetical protein
MNLIPEYITMIFNPFDLRLPSMSFGHFVYYAIMTVIFIYYCVTFKHKSRILNSLPIIIPVLGCGIIIALNFRFGILNGRVMGEYDSDEWRMYIYTFVFIFVYSAYALTIFTVWNKITNIVRKPTKNRADI